MNETELDLIELRKMEEVLQSLVSSSDRDELSQCLRLLSMHLAIYKRQYGELPPASYEKLLCSKDLDEDTTALFETGLREAVGMLQLVLHSRQSKAFQVGGITIN